MEVHQCAVVGESKGLIFDPKWNHEEVCYFLHQHLPRPFEWADSSVSRRSSKRNEMMAKPTWVLLSKEG